MAIGMWGKHLIFQVDSSKINTFRDLTVETGDRWTTHDIYKASPRAEWMGPGLSSFKMTIEVLPQKRGWKPREFAEKLRKYLKCGETAPLIIGGKVMSYLDVRISALSEAWDRVDGLGKAAKVKLDITFTETNTSRRYYANGRTYN